MRKKWGVQNNTQSIGLGMETDNCKIEMGGMKFYVYTLCPKTSLSFPMCDMPNDSFLEMKLPLSC